MVEPARESLRLHDAAHRHGAFCWAERRLFELTGAWAAAPGLPGEVRVHLFEVSAQHSWHASLWEDRLPVLAGVDRSALIRPAAGVVEPMLRALEPGAPLRGGGVTFLAALCRVVVPGLVASYQAHRVLLSPVCDGPSIRAISLVLHDEVPQIAAGAALLGSLDPPEGDLDEITAAYGRPDGLFSWPEGQSGSEGRVVAGPP